MEMFKFDCEKAMGEKGIDAKMEVATMEGLMAIIQMDWDVLPKSERSTYQIRKFYRMRKLALAACRLAIIQMDWDVLPKSERSTYQMRKKRYTE